MTRLDYDIPHNPYVVRLTKPLLSRARVLAGISKDGLVSRSAAKSHSWRAAWVAASLIAIYATSAWADYPSEILATPNLVGYWRFEPDTQANSSVNGYNGTFLDNAVIGPANSGPPFAGVASNSALVLDGNGDGVSTDLSSQVTFPTAATIIAWVYLNQQPADAGHFFEIASRSQNNDDLDFQINQDNLLYFYTDAGTASYSPGSLPLHQWVMVAGTFDTVAGTRRVYIDGRPVGSSVPGPHTASSAPLTIGYSGVWPGRWFDGAIDEVAIFDRSLSDAEIKALQDASGDLIFRSNFTY